MFALKAPGSNFSVHLILGDPGQENFKGAFTFIMNYIYQSKMKILIVLFSLTVSVLCSSNNQPTHVNLTQQATVACWKSGTSHTLTFYLEKGSDRIDRVYTVDQVDPTRVSAETFYSGNGIIGNGSYADPFTFSVTATGDLPSTSLTLSTAEANLKLAYVESPDVIKLKVMSKSIYHPTTLHHVLYPADILFDIYCNFTDVQDDNVFTGQILVQGSILESAYEIRETASLYVLQNSTITDSVNLGDLIQLQIKTAPQSRATGLYAHSCNICDNSDCSNRMLNFTDAQGCSVGNLISPFRASGDSAVTGEFTSFTLGQNFIYYRCYVNYCYQPGAQACQDFCAFNQNGRKKRSVTNTKSADVTVTTRLQFKTKASVISSGAQSSSRVGRVNSTDQQAASEMNTALLAAVCTLASLLFLGLLVAIIVFCRISAKNKRTKA